MDQDVLPSCAQDTSVSSIMGASSREVQCPVTGAFVPFPSVVRGQQIDKQHLGGATFSSLKMTQRPALRMCET